MPNLVLFFFGGGRGEGGCLSKLTLFFVFDTWMVKKLPKWRVEGGGGGNLGNAQKVFFWEGFPY